MAIMRWHQLNYSSAVARFFVNT